VPHLLHLDSSIDPVRSRSRRITAAFRTAWESRGEDFTVTYRDLHADPVPHLTDAASHWAPRLRRPEDAPPAAESALQETLIAELLAADVLLIGAPMYNWSLPSTLKAWVDHVHVPGITAPFDTSDQPLAGRTAVVATSRGGAYDAGTPAADQDHVVPPLKIVLGQALGMRVAVIATSRTLAGTVPALADQTERAERELAAAIAEARDLALVLPE
jgi:FMN-dependent NADH-azoreductase